MLPPSLGHSLRRALGTLSPAMPPRDPLVEVHALPTPLCPEHAVRPESQGPPAVRPKEKPPDISPVPALCPGHARGVPQPPKSTTLSRPSPHSQSHGCFSVSRPCRPGDGQTPLTPLQSTRVQNRSAGCRWPGRGSCPSIPCSQRRRMSRPQPPAVEAVGAERGPRSASSGPSHLPPGRRLNKPRFHLVRFSLGDHSTAPCPVWKTVLSCTRTIFVF